MKKPILILSLVFLAGCSHDPAELLTGPKLSPVGSGLRAQADPIPVTPRMRTPVSYRSTWDDGTDLYRDPRARRTGDVVTVIISMQDKAKLDNKTDRSRDSQIKFGLAWLMDVAGRRTSGWGSAGADLRRGRYFLPVQPRRCAALTSAPAVRRPLPAPPPAGPAARRRT